MNDAEREAARTLACMLAGANYIEFWRRVRSALDAYHQDRMTASETVWQIEQITTRIEEANEMLRALCQDLPPMCP